MKRDGGAQPGPSERRHPARERRDMLRLKRAYEPAAPADGYRILVDRLWPRGLSKEKAAVNEWMKEVAPSAGLRRWFGHDPARWSEFCRRYGKELKSKTTETTLLREKMRAGSVTLLYSAADTAHNNAVALKRFLEAGQTSAG